MASAFCFPLAAPSEKMAPTASSPEAKLVAMSSSWLVLVGVLRPSSCTSSLQVVPEMKAPMTSESVMLGSSVHCLEKRLMKSRRDSSGFYRQLLRSQEFPGCTYVPWKFLTKIITRSAQLWIRRSGRCSSHALAESVRCSGKLRMMSRSSSAPPS